MKQPFNYISFAFVLLLISFMCKGQIAVGQWRDHLPYHQGRMIAKADDKVYVVTASGMYNYNIETGEVQRMSKITGLSDFGVNAANYHKDLDLLVIGYRNGNIDIIRNRDITNVSDIKRKQMTGDKSIYDIVFIDDFAYLATGFGIVELNLQRNEIRNTFFIGELGSSLKINQLAFDGTYLYATTDIGIYRGNINNFLVDFANWEIITNTGAGPFSWITNKSFNHITVFNDDIYVNYYNPNQSNHDTILIFDGNDWSHFDKELNRVEGLISNDDFITVLSSYFIRIYDNDLERLVHFDRYNFNGKEVTIRPRHAYVTEDRGLWIADNEIGLVKFARGWSFFNYPINGPYSDRIFALESAGDIVYGVAGGRDLAYSPTWTHSMLYIFEDERWRTSRTSAYRDLVSLAVNPADPYNVFAGSFSNGLLEYQDGDIINVYDGDNSTLNNIDGLTFYRVGGISFDNQGNLYVANALTVPPFSVMDTDGNWTGLDYSSAVGSRNIDDVIITQDGIKWAVLPRGNGLFVFDDNGNPDNTSNHRYKRLNVVNADGELISNQIFSIAEDKNGYVWVGTDVGIAVFYNPSEVFDNPHFHARQILIPRDDGTDNADILLGTETVTSIVVDGANNKWFGTQSAGVFYTSPDGMQLIHHFKTDNSPLIDNSIICITVNDKSGEVFFGTSSGIISYRATATEGADDFEKVYAFPNPVKPDYHGPITITGLVAGAYVKITDISGNLVYEMRSEGGQAVWYGKNLNGNRVQTGVYLVFSTNEDGSKTDVTKILFIN